MLLANACTRAGLTRAKDDAFLGQRRHDRELVAAGGLEHHQAHALGLEPAGELFAPSLLVREREGFEAAVGVQQRDVESVFADIDTGDGICYGHRVESSLVIASCRDCFSRRSINRSDLTRELAGLGI